MPDTGGYDEVGTDVPADGDDPGAPDLGGDGDYSRAAGDPRRGDRLGGAGDPSGDDGLTDAERAAIDRVSATPFSERAREAAERGLEAPLEPRGWFDFRAGGELPGGRRGDHKGPHAEVDVNVWDIDLDPFDDGDVHDSSELAGSFAVGAGASLDDYSGEIGGTVSITRKTLWDEAASLYNTYVDPRMDGLFGRDLPELGMASNFWDRGVTVTVSGIGGVGYAGKFRVDGKLDTSRIGLGGKLRVPAASMTCEFDHPWQRLACEHGFPEVAHAPSPCVGS